MPIGTPVSLGSGANASSLTVSATASSGSLIVVALCSWANNGANFTGLSDNAGVGNVYTKAVQTATSGLAAATVALFFCSNSGGLPSGSVLTPTGTNGTWAIAAAYCTGANGGNDAVSDVSAFSTTAVTTLSCPATGTLGSSSEILFGAGASSDANMTGFSATGFTNIVASSLAFSYMIVSSNASITFAPSWTNSGRDGVAMAGFKATAAATSSLFRQNNLSGIGSGGPFFQNPLTRTMLGWRKALSGLLIPDRKLVRA